MPEKFSTAMINACKLHSIGYFHYIKRAGQVIDVGTHINITLICPVTTVDSVLQTYILRCWCLYNHKHFCIAMYSGHHTSTQVGRTKQSTEAGILIC